MTRKIFSSLMLAVIIVGSFFTVIPFTKAEEVGIKISPVKYEDLVKPGEVLVKSIKVTNSSPVEKTFYAYLNDFVSDDSESGQPKLIPAGSSPTGLSTWVNISESGVSFAPNEEKIINFTIKVPDDAGPGGYYGAILFGTEPGKVKVSGEDKGAAMATSQKAASLILLQVAGKVDENATVREFLTEKSLYNITSTSTTKIKFLARLENTGNTSIKPSGTISIKNFWGKNVALVHVNDNSSNILRKSTRKFESIWETKTGFGKYTASMGLSFGLGTDQGGQGKQTLYSETSFWIIPWKIIIPVVLISALVIGLVMLFLRIYKDRAVRRAMEQIGARQRTYTKTSPKKNSGDNSLGAIFAMLVVLIILLVIYFALFA